MPMTASNHCSPTPTVVVIEAGFGGYTTERRVLEPLGAILVERACNGDPALLYSAVRSADAVLVRDCPIDRTAIGAMERCRVIVRYGVGADNIDLDAATERRIPV